MCACPRRRDRAPGEPRDVVLAVHPGLVDTQLARTYFKQSVYKPLQPLTTPLLDHLLCPLFLRTTRTAARLVLLAATAPGKEVAGEYLAGRGVARAAAAAEDPALARQLWDNTHELLVKAGVHEPLL